MRLIRRAGGVAVATLLLTGAVAGSASAQTTNRAETYLGNAAGRALNLQIAQTKVTFGGSSALVDSTLKAAATGNGALNVPILGGSNAGDVLVQTTGRQEKARTCASPGLPAQLSALSSLVSLKAACSSSLAEITAAGPHAIGTGTVSEVDLDLHTVLGTAINAPQVQPILQTVFSGLDSNALLDGVKNTTGVDLKVGSTVGQVLTALGSVKTLQVRLGDSTSEVTTEGTKVTSIAKSAGGTIDILPLGVAGLKPVVQIVIGSSSATAVYDRVTGTSTPTFDPSIVTIRINTPTTDALGALTGIPFQEYKIAPNLALPTITLPAGQVPGVALASPCADAVNEYCVLPGTPFETRIALASGRTVTNADGSVGAVADAVKIHALKNIGQIASALNGGVLLELAHSEAGVGGVTPQTATEIPKVEIPRELPRTGGTPWLPIVGGGLLVLAVAGRRVLVRSH